MDRRGALGDPHPHFLCRLPLSDRPARSYAGHVRPRRWSSRRGGLRTKRPAGGSVRPLPRADGFPATSARRSSRPIGSGQYAIDCRSTALLAVAGDGRRAVYRDSARALVAALDAARPSIVRFSASPCRVVRTAFVLGLLLLYFLAFNLGGFRSADQAPLITSTPALTLGLPASAWYARMLRSTVLNITSEDYVRTPAPRDFPSTVVSPSHLPERSRARSSRWSGWTSACFSAACW